MDQKFESSVQNTNIIVNQNYEDSDNSEKAAPSVMALK